MHVILGATGQVGSMLVDNLLARGQPVRAVIRNGRKVQELEKKGIEVYIADYTDVRALERAFPAGSSVFLLTPENPGCERCIDEIRAIIDNYREAVLSSGAARIVGLSSMGAQHASGTGNLVASHMLEHAFSGSGIGQVFVRPAYYYSNWLGYLELVREYGVLPTFFPPEMKLPMIDPSDVAGFLADVLVSGARGERVYEITGPHEYSSSDIARIFGKVLKRDVCVQQVPPAEWESTLIQAGFSRDGAKNLALMTQAVIDGKTRYETARPVRFATDFEAYLRKRL